jgi:hypothetical protein
MRAARCGCPENRNPITSPQGQPDAPGTRLKKAGAIPEQRIPSSDAGEGEGVGEAHGFRVHHGETEEQEAEDGHADAFDGETEKQEAEEKQSGGRQLDGGVAPGDGLVAMAAVSAEKDPAQDGHVVVERRWARRNAGSGSADGRWIRDAAGGRCRR